MTDRERRLRHSTARRRLHLASHAGLVAVLAGGGLSLLLAAAPAGAAGTLQDAQARAAQLESEIQSLGQQVDALDQQYQAAIAKKAGIDLQIRTTETDISQSEAQIQRDRRVLHKAAIDAYVTGGTAEATSALFSKSQTAAVDSSVYTEVASGNLGTSMANLDTAVSRLDVQRQTLASEDTQAASAIAAAHDAYQQAQTLEARMQGDLSQVKGQIATLVDQQRAAAAAAQRAAAQRTIGTPVLVSTPPPPAGGNAGAIAVRAAESQLGVPYVWAAEDPGHGFDCSGLTAWAWSQAGVYLPHYSGAQMADSAPVPISALQPGDLLFYGPGGSWHVAMYIGGGEMIEATHPGTVVRIDPVRFGTGFAGAGRP